MKALMTYYFNTIKYNSVKKFFTEYPDCSRDVVEYFNIALILV